MNGEYLSVSEFGAKHNMDVGRIRLLIADGRIPAIKIGTQWAIPADAVPPEDRRVKSGKYKEWRKPKEKATRYL